MILMPSHTDYQRYHCIKSKERLKFIFQFSALLIHLPKKNYNLENKNFKISTSLQNVYLKETENSMGISLVPKDQTKSQSFQIRRKTER